MLLTATKVKTEPLREPKYSLAVHKNNAPFFKFRGHVKSPPYPLDFCFFRTLINAYPGNQGVGVPGQRSIGLWGEGFVMALLITGGYNIRQAPFIQARI